MYVLWHGRQKSSERLAWVGESLVTIPTKNFTMSLVIPSHSIDVSGPVLCIALPLLGILKVLWDITRKL
jgi:hypothetical protein